MREWANRYCYGSARCATLIALDKQRAGTVGGSVTAAAPLAWQQVSPFNAIKEARDGVMCFFIVLALYCISRGFCVFESRVCCYNGEAHLLQCYIIVLPQLGGYHQSLDALSQNSARRQMDLYI